MLEVKGKYGKAKVYTNNIEQEAVGQVITLLNQEAFADSKVRIMPDVHAGAGCVIGFTADLGDKVIPNIVGVDLGCGMLTVNMGKIDLNLESVDRFIAQNIPNGFNNNRVEQDMSKWLRDSIMDVSERLMIDDLRPRLAVGSLGGGNHFIEISEDSKGNKYLIVHTGSRNFGLQVAKYYQKQAELSLKDSLKRLRDTKNRKIGLLKQQELEKQIPQAIEAIDIEMTKLKVPKDLSFLTGDLRDEYLKDMQVCQKFAEESRESIALRILKHVGLELDELDYFHTVHNYINFKDNVIRKGAISAYKDELVLIPMNMRDGSLLCKGLGNEDWNNSAPHGAGRLMSRSKAKEMLNLEDFKETMSTVYSSSVKQSTLDEAPMAYKPMDEIVENVKETVEILDILKPIYNFKAH